MADFSGSDPIIYREPLQTEQYDSLSLNGKFIRHIELSLYCEYSSYIYSTICSYVYGKYSEFEGVWVRFYSKYFAAVLWLFVSVLVSLNEHGCGLGWNVVSIGFLMQNNISNCDAGSVIEMVFINYDSKIYGFQKG